MSAMVEEVSFYEAICGECSVSSGAMRYEDWAGEWAANHNAENHEDDDPDEIARQNWRDSRDD